MQPVDRVLMTADAVGGVWTFSVDLAKALGDRGIHVTLAIIGPGPDDEQRAQLSALANVEWVHRPFRLEWMADPWDDVAAAGEWLISLARASEPQVIHLNGYCHATLDWKAPVLVTGHSCVLSWWRAVRGDVAPSEWGHYAARVNEGVRAADLVTAPTAAMLGELDRYYGPLARTAVIANGRPAAAARPVDKEPFVLAAGRLWDKAKNISAVCAVAPQLSWPVRVAGDTRGPDGAEVRCEDVESLGRLGPAAMASWMGRAAIYALPARYEPFGLSALEAALAGCALVLGDIPSLREVWGTAALYVAPDNHSMLASALRMLIRDDGLRGAMARRAAARARDLTPERMANSYLDAYAALAGSGRLATPAS
jgi:glycogen synthase